MEHQGRYRDAVSTVRTSISWFIRSICRYAFGLALSRWRRANRAASSSLASGSHSRTCSIVPQRRTSSSS